MTLSLDDFAFVYQGQIIRSLHSEEAHYLSPVDLVVNDRQDKALLLLHGFASSPAVYRALLPKITGYDRIVCPVLPGHGCSIQAFATTTADAWRAAARDCCAKLAEHYAQISVVGLSLGGSLALELSQLFRIQHLYLLAPALKLYYPIWPALISAQILHAMGWKTLRNHAGDLFSDQYQELTYRQLPLPAIIEILSYIQSQTYIQPNCPTDLFLGRHDKVVNVQALAKHYQQSAGITLHWLEHSAHILPLDGDRERLLKAINR
jgi:carboxylesterase